MKRLIALILCLMMCLPAATACAESKEREVLTVGDFSYVVLNDGTAEIVKYTGNGEKPTIPERLDGWKVTSIGEYAFADCKSLTSIKIPNSVTSIGYAAFLRCYSLTSVTIPDSVTSIECEAFSWCTCLTSITIPDSVTSMRGNPFPACKYLTTIKVSPDHPVFATIDGVLFNKKDKCLVCYPAASTASTYTIPDGIRMIGSEAFCWNGILTCVRIPDSVTRIENYAFYGCEWLSYIKIPDSVTSIGKETFCASKRLTTVEISDSVTSIGYRAFADCSEVLRITVDRDSYASEYCRANGLDYTYPDINAWLKK